VRLREISNAAVVLTVNSSATKLDTFDLLLGVIS